MKDTATALYESAEKLGILIVLTAFGENIRVRVPLSVEFCERTIESFGFSVRSRNGLMRNGTANAGGIYDIIMSDEGLGKVRNLGKKSIAEIKTMMLVAGYDELSEGERRTFWRDFVADNGIAPAYNEDSGN